MSTRKGVYLVFEGLHGSGKTTQSQILYNFLKDKYPSRKVLLTHEPGGSQVAEAIRKIVQATKFKERMSPVCDAYLYAAARAQALRNVVSPILKSNGLVLADRSYFSSLAIQGLCQGLGLDKVSAINQEAIRGFEPDLVFVIDLGTKFIEERLHDQNGDKFENRQFSFYKKLAAAYRKLVKLYPRKLVLVDGSGTEEKVFERVAQICQERLHL